MLYIFEEAQCKDSLLESLFLQLVLDTTLQYNTTLQYSLGNIR